MRDRHILPAGIFMALGFAVLVSAAPGDSKTPTQAYLEYQAAIQKASTLAEVLPRLSKEYRAMLEAQPKKEHPVWLGRLKETSNMKDLKITKETIAGDKCTLEGTGTSARGNAVHGKVSMVREGGAWKLDEEAWAT